MKRNRFKKPGASREPSEAGRVGKGGARKRTKFLPKAKTKLSGLCDDAFTALLPLIGVAGVLIAWWLLMAAISGK